MNIKKMYFYFRKLIFYFEFGAHGGLPASVGPGVDRPFTPKNATRQNVIPFRKRVVLFPY